MATRSPARVALMFAGLLAFLAAITFNTLSGFGAKSGAYFTSFDSEAGRDVPTRARVFAGIFQQSTEEVTLKYATPITPAPWVLFIWDYSYIWIFVMFMYFLLGLCRRFPPHLNALILHRADVPILRL